MSFAETQVRKLKRKPHANNVKVRNSQGQNLHYLEGWFVIDQANRIFGFEGWDRETVYSNCVATRHVQGKIQTSYITRVRITVRAGLVPVVREGLGAGEATGDTAGHAHEMAAKAAETDTTKRALSTFGAPFGLKLYAAPIVRNGAQSRSQGAQIPSPPIAPDAAALNGVAPPVEPRADAHAVDKSVLQVGEPKRLRDKQHLKFVASNGCLVCGRRPAQAHHLTFMQPRAMQKKSSDEYTVPLCAIHHDQLHRSGNERDWWTRREIDPARIASDLWAVTRGEKNASGVTLDLYLENARRVADARS